MLYIVANYHCMQMNQTCENGKKPSFDPNFGPFDSNLDPQFFFNFLFFLLCGFCLYQMLNILSNWNKLEKMTKNLILGPILAHLAQIWSTNFFLFFFSKIWLYQSLDIMVSYHYVKSLCTISSLTLCTITRYNIQSWENLVTDRGTEGQAEGPKWFHRMLSN